MLSKKQRLTKKGFDYVFKNGRRVHSPALQLIYVPGGDFHGAVVVGKKVHKRAVDRNRLRRRLYGVLYRYHKQHTLFGSYVLIAKPSLLEVSKEQFSATVEAVLQRAE